MDLLKPAPDRRRTESPGNQGTRRPRRALLARGTVLLLSGARRPLLLGTLGIAGCTTVNVQAPPRVERGAQWGLLPIANHTETPQAGLRAEAIVESLVRTGGLRALRRYPAGLSTESTLEPTERRAIEQALVWARAEQVRYAITGAVDEWRYKVGVDGEPAVGITLQVLDVPSNAVIWSAAGSKSGWSRESLSGVAQKLITELVAPLRTQVGSRWSLW